MVSYIITSLTLDTLPRDVIRLIIRSNVGENKDNLRLISRTWNDLVTEHLKTLPQIDWMRVMALSGNQIGVTMTVIRKDLNHFRSVIPDNWEERHDKKLPITKIKVHFRFPLEKANIILSRVFNSMKDIYAMSLWNLNKKIINDIRVFVRNIEIETLEVDQDRLFRKRIMQIVRQHRIETLFMTVQDISDTKFCKLFDSVPESLLSVVLTSNTLLSENSKTYWRSLAQKIMKKGDIKQLFLMNRQNFIFNECDPFFKFMIDFQYYL